MYKLVSNSVLIGLVLVTHHLILRAAFSAESNVQNQVSQMPLEDIYSLSNKNIERQTEAKVRKQERWELLQQLKKDATSPVIKQRIATRKSERQVIVIESYYNLETSENNTLTFLVEADADAFFQNPSAALPANKELVYGMIASKSEALFFNDKTKQWDGMYLPELNSANRLQIRRLLFSAHERVMLESNLITQKLLRAENGSQAQQKLNEELKAISDPVKEVELKPDPKLSDPDQNTFKFSIGPGQTISQLIVSHNGKIMEFVQNSFVDKIDFSISQAAKGKELPSQLIDKEIKSVFVVGIVFETKDGSRIVKSTMPNTPARSLGIAPGDKVVNIKVLQGNLANIVDRNPSGQYEYEVIIQKSNGDKVAYDLKPILQKMQLPKDEKKRAFLMENIF